MRVKFRNFLIVLAAGALASCNAIFDDSACTSLEDGREVTFVLALSEATGASSRAAWNDATASATDVEGNIFENRLLAEQLRVAVYTTANVYLGDVTDLLYWPINAEGTRYQFKGNLPVALLTNMAALPAGTTPDYKFMVYANSPAGNSPANILYTLADVTKTDSAIPMWGVKQTDLTPLLSAQSMDMGTIWLLRSVAKVEVNLADELTSHYVLKDVSINYHNAQGYVLPEGWDTTTATETLDREGVFRGYRSLHSGVHPFVEAVSGERYVMYLPEYDNSLFAEYEAKISVTLNDGTADRVFTDALQFRNYSGGVATGDVYNLVRNTIYRFNITAVNVGNLELNFSVADWARSDNWEWVQDFSYPTYHNPVLADSGERDGDATNDIFPDKPTMKYVADAAQKEANAFSCWFQILTPVDQTWLPVLRTASANANIKVYKEVVSGGITTMDLVYDPSSATTEISNGSLLTAYNGWYNIKVIPTAAENVGEIVEFGITYTQSWMGLGGSRYLMINGEHDHIMWPNSGTDARIIKIEQVN